MRPDKIISGGQYGADFLGLVAAKNLGIPTGGWAPKGWRVRLPNGAEGSNPILELYGLRQHSSDAYPPRTYANAKDSDGTVWFGTTTSAGYRCTIKACAQYRKPVIENPTPEQLQNWVAEKNIRVLNVAGNTYQHGKPDVRQLTYDTIVDAFKNG